MKRFTIRQLVDRGFDLGDIDYLVRVMKLTYGRKSGATTLTLDVLTADSIIESRREQRQKYRR